MAEQLIIPRRVLDANGDPLSGAKLYAYYEGTTTLETVYTDSTLATSHPSPLVSDAGGNFPPLWHAADHGVKLAIFDANDVEISWSPLDPCPATSNSTNTASSVNFTPIATNSASNVQQAIENVSNAGTSVTDIDISTSTSTHEVFVPAGKTRARLFIDSWNPVSTAGVNLQMQFGTVSAYATGTNYRVSGVRNIGGTLTAADLNSTEMSLSLTQDRASDVSEMVYGSFDIQGLNTPSGRVTVIGTSYAINTSAANSSYTIAGRLHSALDEYTRIQFLASSGSFDTFKARIEWYP